MNLTRTTILFGRLSTTAFWLASMTLCSIKESCADEESLKSSHIQAAMQSERSKLLSGRFEASGLYEESALGKTERSYSIDWKYEFDLKRGTFQFDRLQSVEANPDFRGSVSTSLRIFFCEDTKYRYTFENTIVPIAFLRRQEIPDATAKLKHPFERLNVHGLGFYNSEPILEMSLKGDRCFFERKAAPVDTIQVERESKSVLKLWYEDDQGVPKYKVVLWVDTAKGFAPLRKVTYLAGKVESDFSTDWESKNDVWVPRRLTGKTSIPFLPDGKEFTVENIAYKTSEFELDLNWSSVNDFVSPDTYDFKQFDFPKGTQVAESGKMIHVFGKELPAAPKPPSSRR